VLKLFKIYAVMMVVLLWWSCAEAVIVDINDGGFHEINWSKPAGYEDSVEVDEGCPGIGTNVKVVSGARIAGISGFEDSSITIQGGEIVFSVIFGSRSTGTIAGGVMGGVMGVDNSRITFEGGQINGSLASYGNCEAIVQGGVVSELRSDGESRVTVYGGQIGWAVYATQNSVITIYGSDFAVDESSVSYGPINISSGVLTGILAGGETINSDFYIYESATIMLVPEPGTVLLLGLGVVMLRRKH